jgi:hypothetical protein
MGIGEDFPSPPVPLAGQAFYLLDTDGVYQGFRISQTDANGGNNYDYLVRLNGQPLTVVNADDSINTIGAGTVTFVGGANPYYDIAPAGFSGTAVSGVGYIDFNTSNPALVSGTTIKTINGNSVLGSGNLVVSASPSGVAGAIQFSNGSAFSSDAANLFWDDTNNRLGVGTATPTSRLDVIGTFDALPIRVLRQASYGEILRIGRNGVSETASINYPADGVFAINTAASERMRVNASGNVLIGTTTDAGFKLDVNGRGRFIGATAASGLVVTGGPSGNDVNLGGIIFLGTDTFYKGSFIYSYDSKLLTINGGDVDGNIAFKAATNERMRINSSGNVLVGTTTNVASSILTLASTTKGFLPPRMTTTQKNAIASPAAGLVVYDTTLNKLCVYTSSWETITSI